MNAGGLCTAEERANVLGIFERIEDEDERRFGALDATGQDLVERGEAARPDDEGDALVAVEAGNGGQRSAFDLDDRDAEVRRMEDESLERLAPLRDHEQADRRSAGDERFFDRTPPGHELLAGVEQADG